MDSNESNSKKSNSQLGSKSKKLGVDSNDDMYLNEDNIDFKNWDMQLGKYLANIWSKKSEIQEEWEIDLTKLDIKNAIGQGTYGPVYRGAYDCKDVAVKVFNWGDDHVTAAEALALRASFEQEIAVWHKLDHPNITKFIGASITTTDLKIPTNNNPNTGQNHLPYRSCCVAVEYLQGGTLKNFLNRNSKKKLSFNIVIQLALDLSRGLSYLHSKNIVHRDVKTEKLLLDTFETLKIAGFGVARVEAQNSKDMTSETGTVGYMAPEVLEGKLYNTKCDIYSFGICLWEIYCCDMPYANFSSAEVSSRVVHQNLRPDIPKCCPSSLKSVMKKCWDSKPEKRPNMEEIVKLLESIDTTKGGRMVVDDPPTSCFCIH
ncbi:hypothetical protein R6Q57_002640 [Mikania cordata]